MARIEPIPLQEWPQEMREAGRVSSGPGPRYWDPLDADLLRD